MSDTIKFNLAAETPLNIAELQKQAALLKRHLKRRTHNPPSSTE
jgi:hypothetical protein